MKSLVRNGLSKRAILWAQRNSWRLPRSVRRAGRKLIVGAPSSWENNEIVDDWSRPLILRNTNSVPIVPDPHSPGSPDIQPTELLASSRHAHCLIVTPALDAGGLDEFVAFLARRLPVLGLRVTVMCTPPTSGPDVRTYLGQLCTALQREGTSVLVASPSQCRQWLAANRPDVISAHDPPVWILEQALSAGIPVVETLHGIPTPISTDWSREGTRSAWITSFVAVSELVRRQYLNGNRSFPEDRIVTIPNAFNDTHRPSCDRAVARAWLGLNNEFLFLSLGRHSIQKNAYGLVQAFSQVAQGDPNAHLLIAGRLDNHMYTSQVRALRDELSMKRRIHLRHSFASPSILLAAADCFVLDSFFEGWSLASMEALSAGLPVVLSEVGGARDQVGTDGSRGFVVGNPLGSAESASWESASRMRFKPQPNREEFAAAMKSVIAQRDRWLAARKHLSEESRERFSATDCAKRHADVLFRAISVS
ncbi:glycosyltransferase involved in cell wall biosynthesis [Bradyrhizobium sp. GM2.2]|uniref:glycosyltransferase family 4 protein n=1 Tax=unclassified Bradyrhizobium TaxID=2631580 RepID=UPI001FFAB804|nr:MULTISPECIES: glycosyltransferase family 4 protein [unclassified Bradyrhizobium]MCK1272817.1 glycosyltransferase family 4 protein [Bradyrhizobium sp. 84]MCK1374580.1 glycosyltransferase family 4 protein [Bradyrhizobium sp. 49]MCK1432690.1 glycosyltransferase family 4 protein [Bradyrhizobium sp. 87]